ncbi:hypothetical protein J2128_000111 [Methanomicrobium sp. W14]|uniref:PEGA domain-containing protein n=1 Tax=Methanomicrobium sp. W14 TaxID=2817839 RepID=UPI001AE7E670|nr:PEGA domain-containing protein [Methanomicrobium sp. W14]MBP2132190.1 hypothetical protein [Methanomicrobium sp. W14]
MALMLYFTAYSPSSAWDFNTNEIPDNNKISISMANGGAYYLGFSSGDIGLNSLHITTSTSEPDGTLTRTSSDSGTFYLSDTGSMGYFEKAILMIAIRNPDGDSEINDNFKIHLKVSGYKWTPVCGEEETLAESSVSYSRDALDRDFRLSSVMYGPQNWKPAGNKDYPIMTGQVRSEDFHIFFVDAKVGILGMNSGMSGLTNSGMAKVEYSIENYNGETVVFNAYGYALNAYGTSNGAIAWTNKVNSSVSDKNTRTLISGYIVNTRSSSKENTGDSLSEIDYGFSRYIPLSENSWIPEFGNLNITSTPTNARIYIDGVKTNLTTNCTIEDLPAGVYSIYLEKDGYRTEEEDIIVRNGYETGKYFDLTRKNNLYPKEPDKNTVVSEKGPSATGMYITSYPGSLRIYLDGEDTNYYTPHLFYGLKPGWHYIKLSSATGSVKQTGDEILLSKDVYLSSGQINYEKLTYDNVNKKSKVTVSSNEFETSPFMVSGSLPEYNFPSEVLVNQFSDYITFYSGGKYYSKTITNNYNGRSIEIGNSFRFGTVEFNSSPSGADIFIDGHSSGKATPAEIQNISGGTHRIEIQKDGYYPYLDEIYVASTKQSPDYTVNAVLDEYPYGTLTINSIPQGAKIYLKGAYTGKSTPHTFSYMPIGTYDVGLFYNRSMFKEITCTVVPYDRSEPTAVNEDLSSKK